MNFIIAPNIIRASKFAPSHSALSRAHSYHPRCATPQAVSQPTSFRSRSYILPSPLFRHRSPASFQSFLNPASRNFPPHTRRMATNGEARPKRRQSPLHGLERPSKHLKVDSAALVTGDSTPANGSVYNVEDEVQSLPIINTLAAAGDSPEWQATIESVIKSVVSIHFCQTCSFDTDLSTSSQATGFVVDAERGYILTNRHVVCAGPFWGYCVFDNHEEVSLQESNEAVDHADISRSAMSDLYTATLSTISAYLNSIPKPSNTWTSRPSSCSQNQQKSAWRSGWLATMQERS